MTNAQIICLLLLVLSIIISFLYFYIKRLESNCIKIKYDAKDLTYLLLKYPKEIIPTYSKNNSSSQFEIYICDDEIILRSNKKLISVKTDKIRWHISKDGLNACKSLDSVNYNEITVVVE